MHHPGDAFPHPARPARLRARRSCGSVAYGAGRFKLDAANATVSRFNDQSADFSGTLEQLAALLAGP